MISEFPRQQLIRIVIEYGKNLCKSPKRCEGLLKDYCPDYRLETNLLIAALRENVGTDLIAANLGIADDIIIGKLSKRLQQNVGMTPANAIWAVETWALALEAESNSQTVSVETQQKRPEAILEPEDLNEIDRLPESYSIPDDATHEPRTNISDGYNNIQSLRKMRDIILNRIDQSKIDSLKKFAQLSITKLKQSIPPNNLKRIEIKTNEIRRHIAIKAHELKRGINVKSHSVINTISRKIDEVQRSKAAKKKIIRQDKSTARDETRLPEPHEINKVGKKETDRIEEALQLEATRTVEVRRPKKPGRKIRPLAFLLALLFLMLSFSILLGLLSYIPNNRPLRFDSAMSISNLLNNFSAEVSDYLIVYLGMGAFSIPILFFIVSVGMWYNKRPMRSTPAALIGMFFLVVSTSGLFGIQNLDSTIMKIRNEFIFFMDDITLHFDLKSYSGGRIGNYFNDLEKINTNVTLILLLILFFIGIIPFLRACLIPIFWRRS